MKRAYAIPHEVGTVFFNLFRVLTMIRRCHHARDNVLRNLNRDSWRVMKLRTPGSADLAPANQQPASEDEIRVCLTGTFRSEEGQTYFHSTTGLYYHLDPGSVRAAPEGEFLHLEAIWQRDFTLTVLSINSVDANYQRLVQRDVERMLVIDQLCASTIVYRA